MPADNELELYITNDSWLYKNYTRPLQQRLAAQKGRTPGGPGVTYDPHEALRDFESIVRVGARRYTREFPGSSFTEAEKKAAARDMLRYFETEYKLGNIKTDAALEREIKRELEKQRAGARRKPAIYR